MMLMSVIMIAVGVVMVMIVVMMVVIVVVMVTVVVRDFLMAIDTDGEVRRRDAAARHTLADKLDAGNAEGVQFGGRRHRVRLKFEKCGGEHVACSAH